MGEAETKSIGATEQEAGQNTLYDVAIIGAGPAGVSAALSKSGKKRRIRINGQDGNEYCPKQRSVYLCQRLQF